MIYRIKITLYKGPVAQRITRLTTDQKIVGSNPTGIDKLFYTSQIVILFELRIPKSQHFN